MLSVVIPTTGGQPFLVETLSALVPAAAEGLVRDVALAAAAPNEALRSIADAAGCVLREGPGERAARVAEAAALARSDWLLVLEPGFAPGGDWMAETAEFVVGQAASRPRCAVFTMAAARGRTLSAAFANWRADLLGDALAAPSLVVHRRALARPGRPVRLAAPLYDRRPRSARNQAF
ncbi:glycosyltransferase [Alsobacter sp. SYSU M60028]|uniref:Glycosyltransferase n=1 Tax=Alsobacter ponti TaxID=2962936 RepID=A0ABT1LCP1_9HYPH|nr:glycosyltransferase [Alsobacter ponti]MCP8939265.1 glycosyltransferase [Alsobacter ponti]